MEDINTIVNAYFRLAKKMYRKDLHFFSGSPKTVELTDSSMVIRIDGETYDFGFIPHNDLRGTGWKMDIEVLYSADQMRGIVQERLSEKGCPGSGRLPPSSHGLLIFLQPVRHPGQAFCAPRLGLGVKIRSGVGSPNGGRHRQKIGVGLFISAQESGYGFNLLRRHGRGTGGVVPLAVFLGPPEFSPCRNPIRKTKRIKPYDLILFFHLYIYISMTRYK